MLNVFNSPVNSIDHLEDQRNVFFVTLINVLTLDLDPGDVYTFKASKPCPDELFICGYSKKSHQHLTSPVLVYLPVYLWNFVFTHYEGETLPTNIESSVLPPDTCLSQFIVDFCEI